MNVGLTDNVGLENGNIGVELSDKFDTGADIIDNNGNDLYSAYLFISKENS